MVVCGSPSEFNYWFFIKNGFLIKILRDVRVLRRFVMCGGVWVSKCSY